MRSPKRRPSSASMRRASGATSDDAAAAPTKLLVGSTGRSSMASIDVSNVGLGGRRRGSQSSGRSSASLHSHDPFTPTVSQPQPVPQHSSGSSHSRQQSHDSGCGAPSSVRKPSLAPGAISAAPSPSSVSAARPLSPHPLRPSK